MSSPSQLWELVRHSFDRAFERPCQVPPRERRRSATLRSRPSSAAKIQAGCATGTCRRAMTDRIRTERAQGQPLAMAEVSPRRDWIALRGALVTFGLGLMASLSWPPSCSALNLEDRSAPIETAAG